MLTLQPVAKDMLQNVAEILKFLVSFVYGTKIARLLNQAFHTQSENHTKLHNVYGVLVFNDFSNSYSPK